MNTRPNCDIDHTAISTPYCPDCGRKGRMSPEQEARAYCSRRLAETTARANKIGGGGKGFDAATRAEAQWRLICDLVEDGIEYREPIRGTIPLSDTAEAGQA